VKAARLGVARTVVLAEGCDDSPPEVARVGTGSIGRLGMVVGMGLVGGQRGLARACRRRPGPGACAVR